MKKKIRIKSYYLFLFPSLTGVCVFTMSPFLIVIKDSFFHQGEGDFCGIENYITIVTNKAFQMAFKNTIFFTVVSILSVLLLSIILAFILFHIGKIGHLFQILNLFALTVPVTSVALFWTIFFDKRGILNGIMYYFGISQMDWLNSKYAMLVLILIFLWKNIGFITLLWMIGLSSIPNQVHEAAKIDGAGKIQRFLFVALPNLKQTLYTSILFLLVKVAQIYREVYIMAGDYPSEHIYLLQHTFHNWFRSYDFDKLSSGAVFYAVLVVIVVIIFQKLDETR